MVLFLGAFGNLRIDNTDKVDITAYLISKPQCAELFHLELDCRFSRARYKAGDLLWRSYIDLGDHGRFTADPGNFADIEVGSSFFGFDMEMRHVGLYQVGSYMSRSKCFLAALLLGFLNNNEGSYSKLIKKTLFFSGFRFSREVIP